MANAIQEEIPDQVIVHLPGAPNFSLLFIVCQSGGYFRVASQHLGLRKHMSEQISGAPPHSGYHQLVRVSAGCLQSAWAGWHPVERKCIGTRWMGVNLLKHIPKLGTREKCREHRRERAKLTTRPVKAIHA